MGLWRGEEGSWDSGDGYVWDWSPDAGVWIGTIPGEDVVLPESVGQFRYAYPHAPKFEGWLHRWVTIPQRWYIDLRLQPRWRL